jgi:hypothetical protein
VARYDCIDRKLVVNKIEAETVRRIYRRYLGLGCVQALAAELAEQGYRSKVRQAAPGKMHGGKRETDLHHHCQTNHRR